MAVALDQNLGQTGEHTNVTSGTTIVSSLALSATTDGCLVVVTNTEDFSNPSNLVTGVSHNGNALTKAAEAASASNRNVTTVWYLLLGNSGDTGDLDVQTDGTITGLECGHLVLSGVHQTDPEGVTGTDSQTSATSNSITISGDTTDSMVVNGWVTGDTNPSSESWDNSETSVYTDTDTPPSTGMCSGTSVKATNDGLTYGLSWTGSTNRAVMVTQEFLPAAAGGATDWKFTAAARRANPPILGIGRA